MVPEARAVVPIRPTVATAAASAKDVVNCILIHGSMNQRIATIRAIAAATTTDSRAASAVRSLMVLLLCGDTDVMRDAIPADRLAVMVDATPSQVVDVARQVAVTSVVANQVAGASHVPRLAVA